MAALTFDDPPAEPKKGGALTFDDVPADESAVRVAKLKENLVKTMRDQGRSYGAGDILKDRFTLGLQRPLAGLTEAVLGSVRGDGSSFGERYQAGYGAEKELLDKAEAESGKVGTAAGVAGSLLSGGRAIGAVGMPVVNTIKGLAGQAGLTGAVEGAATNADSLRGALANAVTQGAESAGTAGVLGKVLSWLPASKRAAAAADEARRGLSPEEVKAGADAVFKRLDNAGIAYSDKQTPDLVTGVRKALTDANFDPVLHKDLSGVISRLEGLDAKPVTLTELRNIRTTLTDAIREDNTGRIRRIAGGLLDPIDRFVDKVAPALQIDKSINAAKELPEARKAWRAGSLAAETGWIADKAERRAASTYSGQNADNATRQNFRGVVDRVTKPGAYNPYNPEQMDLLKQIVKGEGPQNFQRSAGNFLSGPAAQTVGGLVGGLGSGLTAALTGGLGGVGSTLLGTAIGGTAAAGVRGLGHAIRNAAADKGGAAVDDLLRSITTGSKTPVQMPPGFTGRFQMPANISRNDLAQILAAQQAARTGARESIPWMTGGVF